MADLYYRIRARREELGMSQDDLAKKMGYKSRSSINKIELGENDIPQSKIEAFAKALETTTSWLMGWSEQKENPQPKAEGAKAKLHDMIDSLSDETIPRAEQLLQAAFPSENKDDSK